MKLSFAQTDFFSVLAWAISLLVICGGIDLQSGIIGIRKVINY